jgi:circadian clock protein KaiB
MTAPRRPNSRRSRPASPQAFELTLYISGATENSRLALLNARNLVEKHLKGRYRLAVIDLFQEPRQARKHDVVAVPMLVRTLPLPVRRMVGNLFDENRVLMGLDILPQQLS